MSETLRLCVVREGQGAPHDPYVMEAEPFPTAFQQVVHRILPCGFEPCRPPAPADDHAQRFIPWLGVERDQREGKQRFTRRPGQGQTTEGSTLPPSPLRKP